MFTMRWMILGAVLGFVAFCGQGQLAADELSVVAGPSRNPITGNDYYLLQPSTWTSAQAKAQQLGGNLVTINSPHENQWILEQFSQAAGDSVALWIGLNDLDQEGTFTWISGQPADYRNWYENEPLSETPQEEDYVLISILGTRLGYWSDVVDDNLGWPTSGVVEIEREIVDTLYVDVINGHDDNTGITPQSPLKTIQAAIEHATSGYTIWVYPGIYQEPINFQGKNLTLQSAQDAAIIQAPENNAVSFTSYENAECVLKNFVIQNSNHGLYIVDASPTITNVTVVNNNIGLIADSGAHPNISNSIFWNNTQNDILGSAHPQYCCIQKEAEGLGNINQNPLFVDPENENYHLKSRFGHYNPQGNTFWTEPILHSELNEGPDRILFGAPISDKAYGPCLSADGLKLYYGRNKMLHEASREVPYGHFTSVRELNELYIDQKDMWFSWISYDGLRLYYDRYQNYTRYLTSASRNSTSDLWGNPHQYNELHNSAWPVDSNPSLTEDELTIFYAAGGRVNFDEHVIRTADRSSPTGVFSEPLTLDYLNQGGPSGDPQISRDGLTLYYSSRNEQGQWKIYKATRASRCEQFSNIEYLGVNSITQDCFNFFITPEEKNVYFSLDYFLTDGIWYTRCLGGWTLDELTSPCIDAGNPAAYPMAETMPNGARVNMGAYGATKFASRSPNVWPNQADVNRDGRVDLIDFAIVNGNWLWKAPWIE